jgi:hypothetical protein
MNASINFVRLLDFQGQEHKRFFFRRTRFLQVQHEVHQVISFGIKTNGFLLE